MDKIECPKCHHHFELTDSLAAPLVAEALRTADEAATKRIEAARRVMEAEMQEKAKSASAAAVAQANELANKARAESTESRRVEEEMRVKLAAAQADQAAAVKMKRELEDRERELELTLQKRTSEIATAARVAAEAAANEFARAKIAESEVTMESMKRTIEELTRKAAAGGERAQGEALELVLESSLAAKFPFDRIEPIAKGINGADCLQVVGPGDVGRILWESKSTKNFVEGWLSKLRDDGRNAKADVLVLMTQTLPKGIESFDLVDGVWVTTPRFAIPLATCLRQALAEAASARVAGQGLETKAGMVYNYLTGPQFKSRVGAIIEAFTTMQEDLDAEKKAFMRMWAKREAQITRTLQNTAGMYGDLQAIAGKSLAEIEGLDVKQLGKK